MGSNFGFNLLATVQTAIGNQDFTLERWLTAGVNEIGLDVNFYGPEIPMKGNIQPVDRSVYQSQGLDFTKTYIDIFCVELIEVLSREQNPDRITWQGLKYTPLPLSEWKEADSWNVVRCVRIEDA